MRSALILPFLATCLLLVDVVWADPVKGATGRVIKVLPQFLDLKGRTSLSPNLYERDAYQDTLRRNPESCSGMRFQVEWKTSGPLWEPLRLQLELRGVAEGDLPRKLELVVPLENTGGWFSHWARLDLTGGHYKHIGSVTAWRVSLWEGDRLLGQQQSFLW